MRDGEVLNEADVLVVGAGVSGLAAAVDMERSGLNVLILEARTRIGGRILSVRDAPGGAPMELGAEFIHGRPRELLELAGDAGLVFGEAVFKSRTRESGGWKEGGESGPMWEVMEAVAKYHGPDVSFAEFVRKREFPPEAARDATRYVEGFNAAMAEEISVLSLAQDERASHAIDGETQYRVFSGYDAIPMALARRLRDPARSIRLASPVTRVQWRPAQVECTVSTAADPFTARAVVVTVPVGVLQAGSIEFSPRPEVALKAASAIAAGQVFRVVIDFHEAFWERVEMLRGSGFWFGQEQTFPTFWTSLPAQIPRLTAWSAGPHATPLVGRSESEVVDAAVSALARLTGFGRAEIDRHFRNARFHDWHADPFARCAYSYARAGQWRARQRLAEPLAGTLFFAGEAAETEGHSGTVHGAFSAGRRAARSVLNTLDY